MNCSRFLAVGVFSTVCGMFLSGEVKAASITVVEDFESFAVNQDITGLDLGGFSLSKGGEQIIVTGDVPGPDLTGNRTILGLPFTNPYRADFTVLGVSSVSVALGDFNQDPDDLFLSAYDSVGNLLNSSTYSLPGTTFGGPTLTVSSLSSNISYVVFGSTGTFPNSVYADNFSFTYNSTPVPEPLTMLGVGTAVAFGAGFKRKLSQKKEKGNS